MAKAVFAKMDIIETKDHYTHGLFASRVLRERRETDLQIVYRYLKFLEDQMEKARYPVQDSYGKWITPMETYGEREANDSIERAEFVITTLQKLLDEPETPKEE